MAPQDASSAFDQREISNNLHSKEEKSTGNFYSLEKNLFQKISITQRIEEYVSRDTKSKVFADAPILKYKNQCIDMKIDKEEIRKVSTDLVFVSNFPFDLLKILLACNCILL